MKLTDAILQAAKRDGVRLSRMEANQIRHSIRGANRESISFVPNKDKDGNNTGYGFQISYRLKK